MPEDYRTQFVRSVEASLFPILEDREVRERVIGAVVRILNDYELMERSTDVAIVDDTNERILKRYSACLMIDGKSEKTIDQYRREVSKLADVLHKNYPDMGVYDIRYYLACEKERGISDRTLENSRANLSAFFQWMTQEEIIQRNPCMKIKPIKYKDKIRYPFSVVEIDCLRSACRSTKERALIEILLASGVRVSELASMEKTDIDMATMSVHVRNGKGKKERTTYITDLAKTHMQKYMLARKGTGPALFYNHSGKALLPNGIRYILNQIGERAGVDNVHPHRFRRTFATGLAARGMDIQEIQKLLGHSNVNTTMEYVYIDGDKIQRSYKQYIA